MPDQKGKRLADALYGQPEEKAAFGVFPQMKPRRSKQDPEAAKDVPRQLLRGWAAGTLGLPGDIEGLVRMLPGLDETPRLPTSEFYLDYLPGKAEGESGKTAAALGTLFGGLGSTKIARGALEAGKGAQRLAERAAAMPSPSGLAAQRGVVKLPGGNWLTGSVERGLEPLKSSKIAGETPAQRIPRHENLLKDPSLSPESRATVERHLNEEKQRAAIDQWIDSNLTNYVKKKMATPEDPVRKLAEEGIVHAPTDPENLRVSSGLMRTREFRGFKPEGEARSQQAKNWETLADEAIRITNPAAIKAGSKVLSGLEGKHFQKILDENPWLEKLPPTEDVYKLEQGWSSGLGFGHIIDVLREDLATGRIRPEQLNKVSMEQAVRRTFEYDQELAEKMAKATAAARADLPVYKEYPEGYRWIELNRPGAFAAESEAMGHSVRGYEPPKGHPDWAEGSGEAGSLGYGHGGWEGIKSGRAKVYSLVDPKGQPHVTVEVGPAPERRGFNEGQRPSEADYYRLQEEWLEGNRNGTIDPNLTFAEWWRSTQGIPELIRPPQITQIKGKQNAAPKEEYLPFVQDFVKGGQWSDVRDLHNTGLFQVNPGQRLPGFAKEMEPGFYSLEDFKRIAQENEMPQEIQDLWFKKLGEQQRFGYAKGGKVHISDNPDTMRLELAGGGAPKAIAQRLKTLREQLAERAAAAEAIQARDRKLPLEQIPEGSLTPEAIEAEIKRMREEKGMAAGGAAKALKALAKGAKEEEKAAIKASEALGQVEGRPLLITQTDRSKVGGKWLGGPGFSSLQHTRPEYKAAEAAWGVAQPSTAKTILGGYQKAKKEFGAEPVMTTMLGTPTQHQSNKMVFEELHRLFKKSAKDGNLDPELLDKINTRLRMAEDKQGKPIFPEDVNILAPDFRKVANTFDRRAVASNLMGGMTVGGKKGQIIDYDEVIRHTTDPALLEAPSGALGNRMFTLSGGIVDRPDLHPAFPSILQGEDLNVMFSPVARELVMRDFIERTMREKGRTPGYMDYTRGYPPTQLITEELLTDLQKKGFAEGGAVEKAAGGNVDRLTPRQMLYLSSFEDIAKLTPHQQREVVANMGGDELRQRMSGYFAGGGAISGDDLIIEERPL
jgi:hypothetical protein